MARDRGTTSTPEQRKPQLLIETSPDVASSFGQLFLEVLKGSLQSPFQSLLGFLHTPGVQRGAYGFGPRREHLKSLHHLRPCQILSTPLWLGCPLTSLPARELLPACLTSHSLSISNSPQPASRARGHAERPRRSHSRDRASTLASQGDSS